MTLCSLECIIKHGEHECSCIHSFVRQLSFRKGHVHVVQRRSVCEALLWQLVYQQWQEIDVITVTAAEEGLSITQSTFQRMILLVVTVLSCVHSRRTTISTSSRSFARSQVTGLKHVEAVGLSVHHTPKCVPCSLVCIGELGAQ